MISTRCNQNVIFSITFLIMLMLTSCTKTPKNTSIDVPRLFNFSDHMPQTPEPYVIEHVQIHLPEDTLFDSWGTFHPQQYKIIL